MYVVLEVFTHVGRHRDDHARRWNSGLLHLPGGEIPAGVSRGRSGAFASGATDALAKLDGNAQTVDAMREHYKSDLVAQAEREMTEKYENDVLSALRDGATVDVPELMVNAEIDRSIRELSSRMESMGISWEQYLQYAGETVEKLRGERREGAAQRVKLELTLDAMAQAEGLEVDEAAVEREEKRVGSGMKLNAAQKRRLHQMTHVDLRRQAAAQRMLEIARGEG